MDNREVLQRRNIRIMPMLTERGRQDVAITQRACMKSETQSPSSNEKSIVEVVQRKRKYAESKTRLDCGILESGDQECDFGVSGWKSRNDIAFDKEEKSGQRGMEGADIEAGGAGRKSSVDDDTMRVMRHAAKRETEEPKLVIAAEDVGRRRLEAKIPVAPAPDGKASVGRKRAAEKRRLRSSRQQIFSPAESTNCEKKKLLSRIPSRLENSPLPLAERVEWSRTAYGGQRWRRGANAEDVAEAERGTSWVAVPTSTHNGKNIKAEQRPNRKNGGQEEGKG
ncbi:hypothetical protein C8R45DRAFT_941613 [Mycena sanguinolenta]|nr:hypothetical protein C8R45DRAFT_941613 [Mycena sanguinolenta]